LNREKDKKTPELPRFGFHLIKKDETVNIRVFGLKEDEF